MKYLAILLALIALNAHVRDPAKVREFRKTHPCPATGKTTGACPGWVVDHAWPLCLLGPDEPWNMQWQAKKDALTKDKLEWKACRAMKGDRS